MYPAALTGNLKAQHLFYGRFYGLLVLRGNCLPQLLGRFGRLLLGGG